MQSSCPESLPGLKREKQMWKHLNGRSLLQKPQGRYAYYNKTLCVCINPEENLKLEIAHYSTEKFKIINRAMS